MGKRNHSRKTSPNLDVLLLLKRRIQLSEWKESLWHESKRLLGARLCCHCQCCVFIFVRIFFLYFFIYFQRFSFDFQPNLPTFIFICYRFNTNPLLFFLYSYRLSLVLMYAQRICLSHGHRLNSTHTSRIESHWLSQCKANIHLFKNEFIHILYLIMLDRFIYTIFLVLFYFFCCFGDFLRFSRRRFFFFFILPSSALFLCFLQI